MITRHHHPCRHLAPLAAQQNRPAPFTPEPLLITEDWHPLAVPSLPAHRVTRPAWSDASLILLTASSVLLLPDVPSRPGVFVLADRDVDPAVWTRLIQFREDIMVLCWPTCRPWLEQQLLAPDAEFLPGHLVQ